MWIMSQLFLQYHYPYRSSPWYQTKSLFPDNCRHTAQTNMTDKVEQSACFGKDGLWDRRCTFNCTLKWVSGILPSFYTTNYFTSNYCITSCYDKLLSLNAAQAIGLECSEEYEFAPFWYSLKGNPTINESNHDRGKKGKSSHILSLSAGYETRLTNMTFILRQHAISFCLRPSPI